MCAERGAPRSSSSRRTSTTSLSAGPPIRCVSRCRQPGGGLKPYVLVRGALEALVSRALVYDLAELAIEETREGRKLPGVWSGGAFFAMERRLREASVHLDLGADEAQLGGRQQPAVGDRHLVELAVEPRRPELEEALELGESADEDRSPARCSSVAGRGGRAGGRGSPRSSGCILGEVRKSRIRPSSSRVPQVKIETSQPRIKTRPLGDHDR